MYLGSSRGFRGVAEGPFEGGFRSLFLGSAFLEGSALERRMSLIPSIGGERKDPGGVES